MDKLKFWTVFSIGVTAGVFGTLLYAPQAGTKTRRQIKRKAADAGDFLQDQYDSASEYVKDQAEELSKQAGKGYVKAKTVASSYTDDLKENLNNAVKSVQS